jgi:NADH:ubiquinone oxidoreductase subunit K
MGVNNKHWYQAYRDDLIMRRLDPDKTPISLLVSKEIMMNKVWLQLEVSIDQQLRQLFLTEQKF